MYTETEREEKKNEKVDSINQSNLNDTVRPESQKTDFTIRPKLTKRFINVERESKIKH